MHNHTQDHRSVQRELGGVPFFCFRINIAKFPLEGQFGEGKHGIWFNEPDRRASSFPLSQDAQPPHAHQTLGSWGMWGPWPHGLEPGFCALELWHPKAPLPKWSKWWRSPGSADPGSPPGEASKSLPGRWAGVQGNLCLCFAGRSPNLPSSKKRSSSNNLAFSDKDLFHLRISAWLWSTLRASGVTSDKMRGDLGFWMLLHGRTRDSRVCGQVNYGGFMPSPLMLLSIKYRT